MQFQLMYAFDYIVYTERNIPGSKVIQAASLYVVPLTTHVSPMGYTSVSNEPASEDIDAVIRLNILISRYHSELPLFHFDGVSTKYASFLAGLGTRILLV